MKNLILLSIILFVGIGCFFIPDGDCTVNIETENPFFNYSFNCKPESFQEVVNLMEINTPDVMEGSTINLGKCALKCVYEDRVLKAHLKQIEGKYRDWWGNNPILLDISKRQYEKILIEYNLEAIDFDSVNIKIVAHSN